MNKSTSLAVLFSLFTAACGGSVEGQPEPPTSHDDAGEPEAAPPGHDAAPDAGTDAPVTCTSCCRVPVGSVTCDPSFGCGACCDTLADGGANPACPSVPVTLCCSTADAGVTTCDPLNSFVCKRSQGPLPQCSNGECQVGDSCETPAGVGGTVTVCGH